MKHASLLVSLLALAACGSKAPATQAPTVTVAAGHYGCRITQGGYAYGFFACDIAAHGDHLMIEKIEGQMKVKGMLTPGADGSLAFSGEVTCDWDATCNGQVTATLLAIDGGWEGELPAHPMAGGGTMSPLTFTVLREAVLESAGGKRYGDHGAGGWEGGGYVGEVPVE